jgi:hypothetical protein
MRRSTRTILVLVGLISPLCGQLCAETEAELQESADVVLSRMSPVEREQLLRNRDRFERLSPQEQQKLRDLHATISADPASDRLKQVMLQYHEWLMSLPSGQRIEILESPPEERIKQIRSIRRREGRQRFSELGARELQASDRDAIASWFYELLRDREQVLALLSPDLRRRLNRMNPNSRRRAIMQAIRRRVGSDRSILKRLEITAAERLDLSRQLSAKARRSLNTAREQDALLRRWIVAALFSEHAPQIDPAELRQFRQSLDSRNKDYLETLPRERMRRELQRMYLQQMTETLKDRKIEDRMRLR